LVEVGTEFRRRLTMKVTTYEATVENGQIKLSEAVRLPEHARIYVVVPGVEEVTRFHVGSPRLAKPERAVDFAKEVTEESHDVGL
jgi:hypothetical protein